jgi:hypothetical protein
MKIDLKPAYATISRKLEAILQSQAPLGIGNKIIVTYDEEGMYINMDSEVGVWLYTGTGLEASRNAINTGGRLTGELLDSMDGNNPNANPGTGVGGIKPRYFLNFTDTVKEMIGDELSRAYAEAIEGMIEEQFTENL